MYECALGIIVQEWNAVKCTPVKPFDTAFGHIIDYLPLRPPRIVTQELPNVECPGSDLETMPPTPHICLYMKTICYQATTVPGFYDPGTVVVNLNTVITL